MGIEPTTSHTGLKYGLIMVIILDIYKSKVMFIFRLPIKLLVCFRGNPSLSIIERFGSITSVAVFVVYKLENYIKRDNTTLNGTPENGCIFSFNERR